MVAYMGAYILMGLVESVFFRKPIAPEALPPEVRAQIERDEALEPDDDDVDEEAKREGEEYI
jgi:CDP-diacylglycerol--serine O-phosphatidyltransferase